METTQERMRAVARAITHAGEDEQELLAMLCAAQEAALGRALREGVRQEDCEETFICAGGMLAALLYGVEGVENCHLLAPTADIAVRATELPVLGTVTVTEMGAGESV